MDKDNKIIAREIKRYYEESIGLERDYIREIIESRKLALRVAVVFGIFAFISIIAGIAGLKRSSPPPVILRVDNASGAVEVLTTLDKTEKTYGETIDIYWLNTYVLNRESYDYNAIQMLYNTTALLSCEEVQKEYYKIYTGDKARDKILKDNARIIVNILSIIPDKIGGSAIVRFTTQEKRANGYTSEIEHYIATITYEYSDAPIKSEDRKVNPLGFQVTSYRVDPEHVPFSSGGQR